MDCPLFVLILSGDGEKMCIVPWDDTFNRSARGERRFCLQARASCPGNTPTFYTGKCAPYSSSTPFSLQHPHMHAGRMNSPACAQLRAPLHTLSLFEQALSVDNTTNVERRRRDRSFVQAIDANEDRRRLQIENATVVWRQ